MVLGTVYLAVLVHWITAVLGLVTWVLYVCIYTPLKKRTSANTLVGCDCRSIAGFNGRVGSLVRWKYSRRIVARGHSIWHRLFLAVPALYGDCLDLSRRLSAGRIQNAHSDRTDWSCRWITGSDIVCYSVTVKCASGSHDEGGAILFLSRNDAFVASIGGCHRFSVPSHGSVCTKNAPDVAHLLTCRLWNAMAESLYFSLVVILLI